VSPKSTETEEEDELMETMAAIVDCLAVVAVLVLLQAVGLWLDTLYVDQ
jgi:hypothetical protein